MTSRAFLRSIYGLCIHTYTRSRIKVQSAIVYITHALCCGNILLASSLMFVATGITKNSSPRVSTGGDEFFSKQGTLNISSGNNVPMPVRAWHCLILEKKNKREWLVVCSDDAFPAPKYGWVCDCGCWTWGQDKDHTPVFSRINEKVVAGRRKKECRK